MSERSHILGRQHFEPKPGSESSQILPPLPEPSTLVVHSPTGVRIQGYTGVDMLQYARLAIAFSNDNEADEMLAAFDHGKKIAREQDAAKSPWTPMDSLAQHGDWVIVTDGVEWSVAKWYEDCWRNLHGQRLEPTPTRYLPVPPLPEVKP